MNNNQMHNPTCNGYPMNPSAPLVYNHPNQGCAQQPGSSFLEELNDLSSLNPQGGSMYPMTGTTHQTMNPRFHMGTHRYGSPMVNNQGTSSYPLPYQSPALYQDFSGYGSNRPSSDQQQYVGEGGNFQPPMVAAQFRSNMPITPNRAAPSHFKMGSDKNSSSATGSAPSPNYMGGMDPNNSYNNNRSTTAPKGKTLNYTAHVPSNDPNGQSQNLGSNRYAAASLLPAPQDVRHGGNQGSFGGGMSAGTMYLNQAPSLPHHQQAPYDASALNSGNYPPNFPDRSAPTGHNYVIPVTYNSNPKYIQHHNPLHETLLYNTSSTNEQHSSNTANNAQMNTLKYLGQTDPAFNYSHIKANVPEHVGYKDHGANQYDHLHRNRQFQPPNARVSPLTSQTLTHQPYANNSFGYKGDGGEPTSAYTKYNIANSTSYTTTAPLSVAASYCPTFTLPSSHLGANSIPYQQGSNVNPLNSSGTGYVPYPSKQTTVSNEPSINNYNNLNSNLEPEKRAYANSTTSTLHQHSQPFQITSSAPIYSVPDIHYPPIIKSFTDQYGGNKYSSAPSFQSLLLDQDFDFNNSSSLFPPDTFSNPPKTCPILDPSKNLVPSPYDQKISFSDTNFSTTSKPVPSNVAYHSGNYQISGNNLPNQSGDGLMGAPRSEPGPPLGATTDKFNRPYPNSQHVRQFYPSGASNLPTPHLRRSVPYPLTDLPPGPYQNVVNAALAGPSADNFKGGPHAYHPDPNFSTAPFTNAHNNDGKPKDPPGSHNLYPYAPQNQQRHAQSQKPLHHHDPHQPFSGLAYHESHRNASANSLTGPFPPNPTTATYLRPAKNDGPAYADLYGTSSHHRPPIHAGYGSGLALLQSAEPNRGTAPGSYPLTFDVPHASSLGPLDSSLSTTLVEAGPGSNDSTHIPPPTTPLVAPKKRRPPRPRKKATPTVTDVDSAIPSSATSQVLPPQNEGARKRAPSATPRRRSSTSGAGASRNKKIILKPDSTIHTDPNQISPVIIGEESTLGALERDRLSELAPDPTTLDNSAQSFDTSCSIAPLDGAETLADASENGEPVFTGGVEEPLKDGVSMTISEAIPDGTDNGTTDDGTSLLSQPPLMPATPITKKRPPRPRIMKLKTPIVVGGKRRKKKRKRRGPNGAGSSEDDDDGDATVRAPREYVPRKPNSVPALVTLPAETVSAPNDGSDATVAVEPVGPEISGETEVVTGFEIADTPTTTVTPMAKSEEAELNAKAIESALEVSKRRSGRQIKRKVYMDDEMDDDTFEAEMLSAVLTQATLPLPSSETGAPKPNDDEPGLGPEVADHVSQSGAKKGPAPHRKQGKKGPPKVQDGTSPAKPNPNRGESVKSATIFYDKDDSMFGDTLPNDADEPDDPYSILMRRRAAGFKPEMVSMSTESGREALHVSKVKGKGLILAVPFVFDLEYLLNFGYEQIVVDKILDVRVVKRLVVPPAVLELEGEKDDKAGEEFIDLPTKEEPSSVEGLVPGEDGVDPKDDLCIPAKADVEGTEVKEEREDDLTSNTAPEYPVEEIKPGDVEPTMVRIPTSVAEPECPETLNDQTGGPVVTGEDISEPSVGVDHFNPIPSPTPVTEEVADSPKLEDRAEVQPLDGPELATIKTDVDSSENRLPALGLATLVSSEPAGGADLTIVATAPASGMAGVDEGEEEEVEEFYIKFKNFSYMHCQWMDEATLTLLDKRVPHKIKRFRQKKEQAEHGSSNFLEFSDELFNPDYLEIERVLAEDTFDYSYFDLEELLQPIQEEEIAAQISDTDTKNDNLDSIIAGESCVPLLEPEIQTTERTDEEAASVVLSVTEPTIDGTLVLTEGEPVPKLSETASPLPIEPVVEEGTAEMPALPEIAAQGLTEQIDGIAAALPKNDEADEKLESEPTVPVEEISKEPFVGVDIIEPEPPAQQTPIEEPIFQSTLLPTTFKSPAPSRRRPKKPKVKSESEGKIYLVKWRSLAYEDISWERERDVDKDKIAFFKRFQKVPTISNKRTPRPESSLWLRIPETYEYKNGNKLRDYQLEGVNWLSFCWYNRQNCILADEMGLGKTVQSITFLMEMYQAGVRGPYLVLAPLSTIGNWQREFELWSDMNVIVYHGSSSSRQIVQEYEMYFRDTKGYRLADVYKFNAIITTYEILMQDCELLKNIWWRACIIDEAHRLKNVKCKLMEGIKSLKMDHRVLLTGTPLQNNIEELWSLLNFLEAQKFDSLQNFMVEYGTLDTEEQVKKLQDLLRPMMLRRLKEDVEKSLAPKEETIIEVELTNIQKKYYRAILEKNFEYLAKGASSQSNVPNLMNVMMELRKCCIHPYLIKGAEEKLLKEEGMNPDDIDKDGVPVGGCEIDGSDGIKGGWTGDKAFKLLINASGKLVLIDKLLPKLKSDGHKVLIFSQMVRCLDLLEDYLIHKRYPFERLDGRIRGDLRQAAIDRFSKPDSDRFVFLLCTRAGGLGINLTAADTCIIFDSDWNPQNDLQAQARCHRIGQSKRVQIYRLICRNTYEREMFDRAGKKLGLDKAVLQSMRTNIDLSTTGGSKDSSTHKGQLSKKEIEDLLKKGAYGGLMDDDNAGDKFCEEDIEQILSRRTQVVVLEEVGKVASADGTGADNDDSTKKSYSSTFAKASFTAAGNRSDIDIDDPNFWQKWAEKAEVDIEKLHSKKTKELLQSSLSSRRIRRQTMRYGDQDELFTPDFEDEHGSTGHGPESSHSKYGSGLDFAGLNDPDGGPHNPNYGPSHHGGKGSKKSKASSAKLKGSRREKAGKKGAANSTSAADGSANDGEAYARTHKGGPNDSDEFEDDGDSEFKVANESRLLGAGSGPTGQGGTKSGGSASKGRKGLGPDGARYSGPTHHENSPGYDEYGNKEGEEDPFKRKWGRNECFRVEKGLITYGWGRWDDMMREFEGPSPLGEIPFSAFPAAIPTITKKGIGANKSYGVGARLSLADGNLAALLNKGSDEELTYASHYALDANNTIKNSRAIPAIYGPKATIKMEQLVTLSRLLILHCLKYYHGDHNIKSFIWELIDPKRESTGGAADGEGICFGGRERHKFKNHSGLSAPVPRGRKGKRKPEDEADDSICDNNLSPHEAYSQLLASASDWSSFYDTETLLCDAGYRRHLQRHANKVLLRVRMLYYLEAEIIGDFRDDILSGRRVITELDILLPPFVDPEIPAPWWNEEADKSLLVGIFKHGYEKYEEMKTDPLLYFHTVCAPGPDPLPPAPPNVTQDDGIPPPLDSEIPLPGPDLADAVGVDSTREIGILALDPAHLDTKVEGEIGEGVGPKETDHKNLEESTDCVEKVENTPVPPDMEIKSEPVLQKDGLPVVKMEEESTVVKENIMEFPSMSSLSSRFRRIITAFQRAHKKLLQKFEKNNEKREKLLKEQMAFKSATASDTLNSGAPSTSAACSRTDYNTGYGSHSPSYPALLGHKGSGCSNSNSQEGTASGGGRNNENHQNQSQQILPSFNRVYSRASRSITLYARAVAQLETLAPVSKALCEQSRLISRLGADWSLRDHMELTTALADIGVTSLANPADSGHSTADQLLPVTDEDWSQNSNVGGANQGTIGKRKRMRRSVTAPGKDTKYKPTFDWSTHRRFYAFPRKTDAHLEEYFLGLYAAALRTLRLPLYPEEERALKFVPDVGDRLLSEEKAINLIDKVDLLNAIRLELLPHPDLESVLVSSMDDEVSGGGSQPSSPYNTLLPPWWIPSLHDRELLIGVACHGLGSIESDVFLNPAFSFSTARKLFRGKAEENFSQRLAAGQAQAQATAARVAIDTNEPAGSLSDEVAAIVDIMLTTIERSQTPDPTTKIDQKVDNAPLKMAITPFISSEDLKWPKVNVIFDRLRFICDRVLLRGRVKIVWRSRDDEGRYLPQQAKRLMTTSHPHYLLPHPHPEGVEAGTPPLPPTPTTPKKSAHAITTTEDPYLLSTLFRIPLTESSAGKAGSVDCDHVSGAGGRKKRIQQQQHAQLTTEQQQKRSDCLQFLEDLQRVASGGGDTVPSSLLHPLPPPLLASIFPTHSSNASTHAGNDQKNQQRTSRDSPPSVGDAAEFLKLLLANMNEHGGPGSGKKLTLPLSMPLPFSSNAQPSPSGRSPARRKREEEDDSPLGPSKTSTPGRRGGRRRKVPPVAQGQEEKLASYLSQGGVADLNAAVCDSGNSPVVAKILAMKRKLTGTTCSTEPGSEVDPQFSVSFPLDVLSKNDEETEKGHSLVESVLDLSSPKASARKHEGPDRNRSMEAYSGAVNQPWAKAGHYVESLLSNSNDDASNNNNKKKVHSGLRNSQASEYQLDPDYKINAPWAGKNSSGSTGKKSKSLSAVALQKQATTTSSPKTSKSGARRAAHQASDKEEVISGDPSKHEPRHGYFSPVAADERSSSVLGPHGHNPSLYPSHPLFPSPYLMPPPGSMVSPFGFFNAGPPSSLRGVPKNGSSSSDTTNNTPSHDYFGSPLMAPGGHFSPFGMGMGGPGGAPSAGFYPYHPHPAMSGVMPPPHLLASALEDYFAAAAGGKRRDPSRSSSPAYRGQAVSGGKVSTASSPASKPKPHSSKTTAQTGSSVGEGTNAKGGGAVKREARVAPKNQDSRRPTTYSPPDSGPFSSPFYNGPLATASIKSSTPSMSSFAPHPPSLAGPHLPMPLLPPNVTLEEFEEMMSNLRPPMHDVEGTAPPGMANNAAAARQYHFMMMMAMSTAMQQQQHQEQQAHAPGKKSRTSAASSMHFPSFAPQSGAVQQMLHVPPHFPPYPFFSPTAPLSMGMSVSSSNPHHAAAARMASPSFHPYFPHPTPFHHLHHSPSPDGASMATQDGRPAGKKKMAHQSAHNSNPQYQTGAPKVKRSRDKAAAHTKSGEEGSKSRKPAARSEPLPKPTYDEEDTSLLAVAASAQNEASDPLARSGGAAGGGKLLERIVNKIKKKGEEK